MSESMAFIGGVAVAGLAALLLLKGAGGNLAQNFSGASPQAQQPAVAPPVIPAAPQYAYAPQNPPSAPSNFANEQLRTDMDRIKLQMDDMQRENDRLKNRNEQLQTQINHQYQSQLKVLSPQNIQNTPQQAMLPPAVDNHWLSSGILWGAVGGMALTVGGGVVIAGVSALFSQKPRPSRTVQVIHPYNSPPNPSLAPIRRAEFLPPRPESRRAEVPEYEDMY